MATDRLERYRAKRDFTVTAEPSGSGPAPPAGHRFVVQRHRASRLHYDLRLEAAGVLLSWAVPKGPTLDPDTRRLAVQVEDHPLDYYDFEGVIPAGEYGGGDVVVWDWGTWDLVEADDPLAALDAGNLHFDLHGEKLRGRFVLIRTKRGAAKDWLLLHKHDDDAVPGWDPEQFPRSVKSGRTNDEVKDAPAASWSSGANWAPPTADELGALDALGKSGTWAFNGQELKLTNLDKVFFPKPEADQARPHPPLRQHCAGDPPVRRRPPGEPAPLPGRHRRQELLAQVGAEAHAGLDRHVPPPRRQARRGPGLPRARHAGGAGVGRELRGDRTASVDIHRRAPAPPDMGDDRHRSGRVEHLRRRPRARPPAPHRARPPRRAGDAEGDRPARHRRSGCPSPARRRSTTPARSSRR